MSGSESAGIWVGNRLAARVQLTPEDPVLTYTDDWKASGFALSPALPLTGPADSSAVTAFLKTCCLKAGPLKTWFWQHRSRQATKSARRLSWATIFQVP